MRGVHGEELLFFKAATSDVPGKDGEVIADDAMGDDEVADATLRGKIGLVLRQVKAPELTLVL